jgi:amino acid transporter
MSAKPTKLKAVQLAAVIFLTVSGGPYGLEPLLTYAGNNAALVLLLVTPFLWDIPSIFTVLELNSMMPVTGGYYQWVKHALSLRWAFYEGWWTWLYTFVDLAIYPVLFVEYAAFFFPQVNAFKIPVCLAIIWSSAALNIRGIVPVGKTSLALGIAVIVPFIILFIAAIAHPGLAALPAQTFPTNSFSATGLALYTIMWNFIGWDNTTTYADEVEKPVKTYIISVAIAFFLILFIYTATVYVAIRSGIDHNALNENGFPAVGRLIGGNWLGALLAAGGMASALGLYNAVLLSVSRVPQVMADDGLMPRKLNTLHAKYKSPYISIIICSVVVSIMTLWAFEDLLVIDVTVYGAALFLEYVALIALRIKEPDSHRPFKISLGVPALIIVYLLPLAVYSIALIAAFSDTGKTFTPVLFAVIALFSGEIIWRIINLFKKKNA